MKIEAIDTYRVGDRFLLVEITTDSGLTGLGEAGLWGYPDAAQEVPAGTVCYWIEGNALAFPFGPTPISETETPKLAAPCNLLGHLEGRWDDLADVSDGDMIRVEWADPGQFTQQ